MLRRALRAWRSHPTAVTALIGAIFGAANAVAIEIGGWMHGGSSGVLPLLWEPDAAHRSGPDTIQTALLLLIEVAGNVLAFAFLFAIPVALIVGIRRILPRRSDISRDELTRPTAPDNAADPSD